MADILGTTAISIGSARLFGLSVGSDKCPRDYSECLGASVREDNLCPHFQGLDTVDYGVVIHCAAAEEDDLQL